MLARSSEHLLSPDRTWSSWRTGQLLAAALCLCLLTIGVDVAAAAPFPKRGTEGKQVAAGNESQTKQTISVGGYEGSHGSWGLQWAQNSPANDNFASATVLPGRYGSTAGTSVGSTGEPGEPASDGGAIADNSVWYTWTPPSGPAVVRLRNAAGGLDPSFAVYTGTSLTGLTPVVTGTTSASFFNAFAGTPYRIAVDGHSGSTGTFTLEYILGDCNGRHATMFANGGTTNGTAGDDVIVGSTIADTVNGGAGNDRICTLTGNDTIRGEAGNDQLFSGIGNDIMQEDAAPNGRDRLAGDVGADTVLYNLRSTAINADLSNITNDDGAAGEFDMIVTAEVIQGGSGNDTMKGNAARENFRGNAGNDQLLGGAGNDVLHGGPGSDSLFGEAGLDALTLVDGVSANDSGDGGADVDTATQDPGDTVVNVP